ncbi:MAG: hypothetical protein HC875_11965 [Anaerolineales bacterium]|nr:hypothetical protein [Anaerolineales bacterium]
MFLPHRAGKSQGGGPPGLRLGEQFLRLAGAVALNLDHKAPVVGGINFGFVAAANPFQVQVGIERGE